MVGALFQQRGIRCPVLRGEIVDAERLLRRAEDGGLVREIEKQIAHERVGCLHKFQPLAELVAQAVEHGEFFLRRRSLADAHRARIAPIVEAGMGSTYQDGTQCETPEQVRAAFDRIPLIVAKLDSFIAAGAPVGDCSPIAWH